MGNAINVGNINLDRPWSQPFRPAYGQRYWGYHHRKWGYSCWYWGSQWRAPWSAGNYVVGFVPGAPGALVFHNPYVNSQPSTAGAYNYSQPIVMPNALDGELPSAAEATLSEASAAKLDIAQSAFKHGKYEEALAFLDSAIEATPTDAILHEFRALCLLALGRYDEAAPVLYTVLAAGPGWDWQTMRSFYGDPGAYAKHLWALEIYVKRHPGSAAANFVLAYQYMCLGELQAAATRLQVVTALKPDDTVSAALLKSVTTSS